jgi:hypothetical protein
MKKSEFFYTVLRFFCMPADAQSALLDWVFWLIKWAVILFVGLVIYSILTTGDAATEKKRDSNSGRDNDKTKDSSESNASPNPELEEAYKVFGCVPHDSDDKIRRCYRELVKEAHVDAL